MHYKKGCYFEYTCVKHYVIKTIVPKNKINKQLFKSCAF